MIASYATGQCEGDNVSDVQYVYMQVSKICYINSKLLKKICTFTYGSKSIFGTIKIYVHISLASGEWFTKQRPFNLQYCVLYLPNAL